MATASQILSAIETAIYDLATNGAIRSYTLPDGRNIQKYDLDQLRALASEYRTLAAAEASTTSSRTNFVRFSRPR